MDKQQIADFFDRCAPGWDADMIRNEETITAILNNAGIREGCRVLDVACGTGVLFPDYLRRGAEVTGIDLSPKMAAIAREKFPQVTVIAGDVEAHVFDRQFDCVMVYNAFPHFPEPEHIIATLAKLVRPGGRLSVAHGMSRAQLQQHHAGRASQVSIDLLHERRLASLFSRWFDVDVIISTDRMYQVCGTRRDPNAHAHSHDHDHDHGHSHDHTHSDDATTEELLALMKYMVSHNDAHCQELAALADRVKESGNHRACRQLLDVAADFDMANARLASILDSLTDGEE